MFEAVSCLLVLSATQEITPIFKNKAFTRLQLFCRSAKAFFLIL